MSGRVRATVHKTQPNDPGNTPVLRSRRSCVGTKRPGFRIEEELHNALTSHRSTSVGRRYGAGVPLDVLADAVAKVSYKALDLLHLHRDE